MKLLVEFLQTVLPAGLMLYLSYLLVRAFLGNEQKKVHAKLLEEASKVSIPLRLQAYERLCLLLERMMMSNLVPRVVQSGSSAKELQCVLLEQVREEYNHNISQQIYVSSTAWEHVKVAMEETVMLINHVSEEMPPDALQAEMIKKIFARIGEQKYDSVAHALSTLKKEVQEHLL